MLANIANWTQESTYEETINFIKVLALSHAREGGPEGERIADYIISGDFLSLCDFDLSYETTNAYHAGNCRQALAFFQKADFIDLGRDKRTVAYTKFLEAESLCKETNELLLERRSGKFSFFPDVDRVFHAAQRKIASVLGPVPAIGELKYRFGPGATTLTKKKWANAAEKLGAGISCSEDLAPFAGRILEEMPHLASLHGRQFVKKKLGSRFVYRPCGDNEDCRDDAAIVWHVPVTVMNDRLEFVPKNAKTDRAITVAGSLNLMVQLAVGDLMARKLKRVGVDLRDQSMNQHLAFRGSMNGSLATLDLSSASDTISREIVYELLPVEWALLLDACRCSSFDYEGSTIQLEKFSSMGNGFTFALESLIFWALSSSCNDDGFASVYGDDIIVPTDSVPLVKAVLDAAGFIINMEKSFWTGPFRESCGADYFRGIDIRPYYQKTLITPAELFRLHNFYVRRRDDERAKIVRSQINPSLRIYGPDGYGDGHLLGDWNPRPHKRAFTHGYSGVLFDTFKSKGRLDRRPLRPGDRILPVYSIYIRENGDEYLPNVIDDGDIRKSIFLRRFGRSFGSTSFAAEPIPSSSKKGEGTKILSYPGSNGYKRVSIYVLDPAYGGRASDSI